jgi:flagellar basal-body rod protein FlgB
MTDSVYGALQARMSYLTARQGVIAENIANANTPGYLARDVTNPTSKGGASTFAMAMTNARHMQTGGATGGFETTTSREYLQHNGNSVRMDQEMLHMNQTQLDYRMLTQLYTKQTELQRIALKGQ